MIDETIFPIHLKVGFVSSLPICVETATPILEVARLFESNNINRVPVLDKNSNLTGIIARSDLVQALC
jgi:CBS domain-containing protein